MNFDWRYQLAVRTREDEMTFAPFVLLTLHVAVVQVATYNPLQVDSGVRVVETEFSYGEDQRVVPLKMYLPAKGMKAPTILYSHGLGGSRDAGTYLGMHWAGRGFAVVTMQHAGSDRNVIKGVPIRDMMTVLKKAANGQSAQARYRDVAATIDHLETLNRKGAFAGRFDLQKIGMGGHSFGAVTTQGVSGQRFGPLGQRYTDQRIKAALALSPSSPSFGKTTNAFSEVRIPWMLMTGTKDASPIARTTPEARREVFRSLPANGHFFELLLDGAKHEAFADESRRRFRRGSQRNPNHHKAIKAISTAFWDTYLNHEESAKKWLHSDEVKSVLEPADVWQKK